MLIPRPVAGFVLVVATLLQIANFGLPFIPGSGYHTDPTITGGFMTAVGLVVTLTQRKDSDEDDDDPDDEEDDASPPPRGGRHHARRRRAG